ncbi:STAS-like domain-containing protein [Pseudomonas sp. GM50]|uniref:STAS-like domain-containing protein n=1 Tax=Pseudomonas sp. GM50 TaxID=1144332 RepID=UPI0006ACB7C2|nr:STAS-like domain-containing protein [Pseudomonas sp. GM50]
MKGKIIKIKDECPFPCGRFREDGPGNAQAFREDVLQPALATENLVTLDFSDLPGWGSSWLSEVVGGLLRDGTISKNDLITRLNVVATTDTEKAEVMMFIKEAEEPS